MTTEARAFLGAGKLRLALFNTSTQAWGEFGAPLDADKFEIKPDFDEKTSTSRRHEDYGQARASVILPKPTQLTIDVASASSEALGMQFQAIVQNLSQAAASVNDLAINAKSGGWVSLGKVQLSDAGFTVTDSAGTITYVLGVDYEVNWARGEILAKADGAITNNQALKVDFACTAVDGKKLLGGRVAQVRVKAAFDGVNMVNSATTLVDVHEAVLSSNNGFDFLSNDFNNITLSGKIVVPSGKTEGYEIRIH